jgi:ATP adenylyltransferase
MALLKRSVDYSLPAIWAPWREGFILGKKEKGCIFCRRIRRRKDKTDLILYRGKKNFVILNRYPYTSGHLMVVPNRHIAELAGLTPEESAEMMGLAAKSIRAMKKTMQPEGFNLGMNLGRAAGAGVAGHLHLHVVPRWAGDANFMPVVGKTKVFSVGLQKIYDLLYPHMRGQRK